MATVDERLKNALVEALACADAAANTLVAAMLADCLAQMGWEGAESERRY